ncbi:855_t:CDS:2 [Gigaspora margarita]|uniref:855_t:CDS:1 n=1 Tax=Gigaspora margarita TaxID=4874 RepID=A0ABN7VTV3_GIGMA|nr:855_t:CDS:2 [Gigaspora margarita]
METITKSFIDTAKNIMNNNKSEVKESNHVKVKSFYGTEDENPFEWFDIFERAAEANNWPKNQQLKIASGYLKEMAADWYKENRNLVAPKNLSEAIAAARRVEAGDYYGKHSPEVPKITQEVGNELSDLKQRIEGLALNYATLAVKMSNSRNNQSREEQLKRWPPDKSSLEKRKMIECYKCSEIGHIARDCRLENRNMANKRGVINQAKNINLCEVDDDLNRGEAYIVDNKNTSLRVPKHAANSNWEQRLHDKKIA